MATVEREDGFMGGDVHSRLYPRRLPLSVRHFHLALNGDREVERKVQVVGRKFTLGFHIERRHEGAYPNEVARQIAAREFGFPLAAEAFLVAVFDHRQVTEFDVADRRVDRACLENEIAEFEIHLAVVFREINRGGEGSGCARFSAHVHHELVGEGAGLRAGTQGQQCGKKKE